MATYGNNKPWRAQEIPNSWRHWTWFFWIPGSAFQPVWKNCWVLELWYLAPSGTLESRKAFLPKPLMSLIPHCSQLRQCMRAPSNLEYIIIISRLCWLRPEAYLNPSEPQEHIIDHAVVTNVHGLDMFGWCLNQHLGEFHGLREQRRLCSCCHVAALGLGTGSLQVRNHDL